MNDVLSLDRVYANCMKYLVLLVLFLSYPQHAADIDKLHSLNKAKKLTLTSEITDHTYHIYIKAPANPKQGVIYPTVYLLDGGITFPLLASYSHYLKFAEDIPDVIIVGISYGSDDRQQGNKRSTDFTAPSKEREFWGGAEKFSSMLRKELFPLVEQQTPSDPEKRVIFGQSLGGQFVIYSMMFQPDLFFGHISSNPALHRNVGFFQQPAVESKAQQNIFIARARNDAPQFITALEVWLAYWNQESHPWIMQQMWFEGHNHFSIAPNAYRRGLMYFLNGN